MPPPTGPSGFIIPYSIEDGLPPEVPQAIPITYYVLCGLGFLMTVISCIVQFAQPANYGKFDKPKEEEKEGEGENSHQQQKQNSTGEEKLIKEQSEEAATEPKNQKSSSSATESGIRIPQRIAHCLSDFIPGVPLFIVIFFTATRVGEPRSDPSYVMLTCWLLHYVWRGILTPLMMRYSSPDVDIGIMLGGFFPNAMFNVAIALHISVINYAGDYFRDPRFGIGLVIFVIGYVCNRWADLHLRSLREESSSSLSSSSSDSKLVKKGKYVLPTGGLFKLCYCPNYFFEFVEWVGFAILSSSLAGTIWALFGLSTFLPRSLVTRAWYLKTFGSDADEKKAALIPFLL